MLQGRELLSFIVCEASWHIYLVFIIFLIYSVANGHAYLCL